MEEARSPFLKELPLMESFLTIQGEGFHTGTSAYFIRLGGCDVGCVWCDVKESWDADQHPIVPIKDMVHKAQDSGSRVVVITGGEPLMYDLTALTQSLREKAFDVHIETSGVYPLTGDWDWVCFSPKKFKEPQSEFYQLADELKVVIYHKSDFEWAESHAEKMSDNALLFLQPEWSKSEEIVPLIVDYVKRNPKWRISLQTHKYIDIP